MYPTRPFLALSGALWLAILSGCGGGSGGGGSPRDPSCSPACGDHQVCAGVNECACAPGFADCDGAAENGCETEGACPGCTYEGDTAFCARFPVECGEWTGRDTCNVMRTVECGGCPDGTVCNATRPNRCGKANCTGESNDELCRAASRSCGSATVEDRCGVSRKLSCGTCPANQRCDNHGACVAKILNERDTCVKNGMEVGSCDTGLVCTGSEQDAVCLRTCTSDAQCRGNDRCALGALRDGTGMGICGDLRVEGQSCHGEDQGPDFCWDNSRPEAQSALGCVQGTCRYVCGIRGAAATSCPYGFMCNPAWNTWPDVGADVQLCEATLISDEWEHCMAMGTQIAICSGELECVHDYYGFSGICRQRCRDDDACPPGEACALGILDDGDGLCANLRRAGEACDGTVWTRDLCWDPSVPASSMLGCMHGECGFACDSDFATEHPAWSCPHGFECGPSQYFSDNKFATFQGYFLRQCLDVRSHEKGPCSIDEDCMPGLTCVDGRDGAARCQPVCTDDEECAAGRVCLQGAFADGRGACVYARQEGQGCIEGSVDTTQFLCIDDSSSQPLACIGYACSLVCGSEGDGLPPADCPEGLECTRAFYTVPGYPARVAVCRPPCVPPTDAQLCASRGAGTCSTFTTTDSCGTLRTVTCNSCPTMSTCNGNQCLSADIPENGPCLDRLGNVVACAPGLTCVTFGTGADQYGVCKETCTSSAGCSRSQTCALGTLASGGGICGSTRQQGQWCTDIRKGSSFCWDAAAPSGSHFECLDGTCELVCGFEGYTRTYDCPANQSCNLTYRSFPDWQGPRLQVCR